MSGALRKLEEWKFTLDLMPQGDEEIPQDAAVALVDHAGEWADQHGWVVGGGGPHRRAKPPHWRPYWSMGFGLCIGADGDLIPENRAEELLAQLREVAARMDCHLAGGFGPFETTTEDSSSRLMEDEEQEITTLRGAASEASRRAVIRWCIRWAVTLLLVFWWFPRYPVLWWSLLVLVPLGLFSLYSALSLRSKVEARCAALEQSLDNS